MSSRIPRLTIAVSITLLLGMVILVGCSGGGTSVIAPGPSTVQLGDTDPGRVIWTIFDVTIDPVTLEASVTYPRMGEIHVDVTSYLIPPSCTDCVKVQVVQIHPATKIYDINVTLRNPTTLTGYDVRGTLLFDPGDPRELTNPDDYTKIFDDDTPADINPFIVFAKVINKRTFSPGMSNTEQFKIKFPSPPNFNVHYVVDAAWPNNQKDPYEIVEQVIDGDLDVFGFDERTVSCIVRDWQNNADSVTVDLSSLGFAGEVALTHGAGDYWYLPIKNENGAAPGDYRCRITATSSDSPWAIYDYMTITVAELPPGPPIWVDTIGITNATPGNGEVLVEYGSAIDPDIPVHYNIYWSQSTPIDFGTADTAQDADGSPYLVTSLTNGQDYYFAVRAEDALGFEDTNTVELHAKPFFEIGEVWHTQTQGVINSSPAFVDLNGDNVDDVVIGSEDSKVWALSGTNGSVLWTFDGGNWFDASPAVAVEFFGLDIDVIIGSYDGNIYRIHGDTGEELWEFPTGDKVHASAALTDLNADGVHDVIVGSFNGKLFAIDGADGTQLWMYQAGGPIYSSAALGDVTNDGIPDVFVGSRDNKVHAVNGATGAGLWTFTTGDWVNGSPALYDFNGDDVLDVAVTSLDGFMYVISGADQSALISFETLDKCWTSPALGKIDGDEIPDIVFGSDDFNLYAVSGADGSKIWSFSTGDRIFSSAALADLNDDGIVDAVVGSDDFSLYLVNGSTGESTWQIPSGNWIDSSPCLGDPDQDGVTEIAIGSFDGNVYLLSGDMPYPDSSLIPWPKFRRDLELTGLFN